MTMILLVFVLMTHNQEGYLVRPQVVYDRIIATDDHNSSIYSIRGGHLEPLLASPGCGYHYSISPDGRCIGLKIITADGLQYPVLFDIAEKRLILLHEPVQRCGQVSFAADGRIAFTIDRRLFVQGTERTDTFELPGYANLAPISPDGRCVCFNDEQDQLWLLELSTGQSRMMTDREAGYWGPRWSGDSRRIVYSSLAGILKVYDLAAATTRSIGKGCEPAWSPDGRYLVYHVDQANDHDLVGSELFLTDCDKWETLRLTETSDRFESDPCFTRDGHLIFADRYGNSVYQARMTTEGLSETRAVYRHPSSLLLASQSVRPAPGMFDSLNIPYLHQVYDTPDWFNGHWACAPTSSMMAIAYYRRLPRWECLCSNPYPHTSYYGRYICERYYYRETNYNLQAQDPNGTWAMGGYGYMWSGSNRPYTMMATYHQNHSISSTRDDSPTLNEAVGELNARYPYALCVGLTTAGHLILGVGYAGNGIIISNDPYGNKNQPPYPNYYGKYARYDWPGYNNGYQNLTSVYWTTTVRGAMPAPTDTIVDDLAIDDGFYLHTTAPATMAFWWDQLVGFRSHSWWTYTTGSQDTCCATWTPVLPRGGDYEVSVYIPDGNATTVSAQYRVFYSGGNRTVVVDQFANPDQWVSLGTFPFMTTGGYLRLGDATGAGGYRIAFDAARWSYRSMVSEAAGERHGRQWLVTHPSVIRNELHLSVETATGERLKARIFDAQGRSVLTLDQRLKPGRNLTAVDVRHLAAGAYFVLVESDNCKSVSRFVVLR